MIKIDIESTDIRHKKYEALIDFLLSKCDCFSFSLPNYDSYFDFSFKNFEVFYSKYLNGMVESNWDNYDFLRYKSNVKSFLDSFNSNIISCYRNIKYFDQKYGYENEIYIIEFNTQTAETLKKVGDLYKWLYPSYPEDLYFFKEGLCYLKSITHEKICVIYDDNDETIDFLEKNGFEFYLTSSTIVPTRNPLDEINQW